ncbi:MAG: hypothetical protein AB7K09_21830 [Planctomycetota bacterium]
MADQLPASDPGHTGGLFPERAASGGASEGCPVEGGRHHLPVVFLSIKPWWAEAILAGSKTVELRKSFAANVAGCPMYLYATSPRQCVIGRVLVESIVELPPDELWAEHGAQSSVTRAQFDAYYERRATGTGVLVAQPVALEPLSLREIQRSERHFRPPMSYCVLDADHVVRLQLGRMQSLLD